MAQNVLLPDGRVAEFPDGTEPEAIHKALRDTFPDFFPSTPRSEERQALLREQRQARAEGATESLTPNWQGADAAVTGIKSLTGADSGVALTKGLIGVPEALVGLTDLLPVGPLAKPFGGAGKLAEEYGFRPKEWKQALDEQLSPEQRAVDQRQREAMEGKTGLDAFGTAARFMLENPSTIKQQVVESLPSMALGGGISNLGLKALAKMGPRAAAWAAAKYAPAIAGGVGEGLVTAGQTAEGIRQQTDDGRLTWGQAGAALAAGTVTGAIGAASGSLAKKLGFEDFQNWMAKPGALKSQRSALAKVIGGALTEGLIEELPQSSQEQIWQNIALGKPWDEGVAEAAAQGLITGAAMGAGSQLLGGHGGPTQPTNTVKPPPLPPANPVTGQNLPMPPTVPAVAAGTSVAAAPNLPTGGAAPAPVVAPVVQQPLIPPTAVKGSAPIVEQGPVPGAPVAPGVDWTTKLSPADQNRVERLRDVMASPDATLADQLKARAELKVLRAKSERPADAPQNVPVEGSVPVQPPGVAPVGPAQPEASAGNRPARPAGGTPQGPVPGVGRLPQPGAPVAVPGQRPSFTPAKKPSSGGAAAYSKVVAWLNAESKAGRPIGRAASALQNAHKMRLDPEIENDLLALLRNAGADDDVPLSFEGKRFDDWWDDFNRAADDAAGSPDPVIQPKPRNRIRGDAAVQATPQTPLNIQREPLVDPDLAGAIQAVREGYNPVVDEELNNATPSPQVAKVNSWVASMGAPLAGAAQPTISVVDSGSDLPAEVRAGLQESGHDPDKAAGVFYEGKVYLVAANIGSQARALEVVRHELAHAAMASADGQKLIADFVATHLTPEVVAQLEAQGYRRAAGESEADFRARLGEEFIAKEHGKNSSTWQRLVAAVQQFLAGVGLAQVTPQEAAAAIMRTLERAGKVAPEAPAQKPQSPTKPTKLTPAEQARLEELKKRLRGKLGQVSAGVDPEIGIIAAEMASLYAKDGIRRFKDFAARIQSELPELWDSLKSYLRGAWVTAVDNNPELEDATREQASADIAALDAPPAPANPKQAEEERELQLTLAAREIARGPGTPQEKYARLVALYEQSKRLGIRTAESKTKQAYSTPPPLAYLAGLLADIEGGKRILEPTAGNGMLLITAPDSAQIIANEIDPQRVGRLRQSVPNAIIKSEDATGIPHRTTAQLFRPDRLIANPPFGSVLDAQGNSVRFPIYGGVTTKTETPSIDLAIMLNSLDTLTPDGRAVIIIGSKTGSPSAMFGSPESRAAAYRRPEFLELFKRFNVTDWFTVDGSLYEGMGAGWPVDVVVINGKGETPASANGGLVRPFVQPPPVFKTWQELETKLQDANRIPEGRPPRDAGVGGGEPVSPPRPGGGRPGTPPAAGPRPQLGTAGGGSPADQPGGNPPVRPDIQPDQGSPVQPPRGGESPAGTPAVDAGATPRPEGAPGVVGDGLQPAGTGIVEGRLNVPYVAVSQNADPKLVSPVNLADPTRAALLDLEREVGLSVDAFVANRLGWTQDDLFLRLSSAQIDAVALAIRNIERGSALINGDQTGVGKGRTAAAIIEYAKRVGKVPVFITAKKTLYEDMAGRDLPSVGNKTLKPFITDSQFSYVDGRGNEVRSSGSKADELAEIARTGRLPAGHDAFFTTYEQLKSDKPRGFSESARDKARRKRDRQAKPDGPRYAALRALAPNAILILDEAHVAAGQDSDLNIKLQDEILPLAGGTYMLTATFSKRADNLGLYSVPTLISRSGLSTEALVELLQRGGNALQQALSSMLTRAGEFVRREQNYDGVNIKFVAATPNPEAEAEAADTYTSFLGDLKRLAAQINIAGGTWADDENQIRPDEAQVNVVAQHFGSRLFNLSQQYLLALRAPNVVREALRVLREPQRDAAGNVVTDPKTGQPVMRKPFISLYNTMAGPIVDLQQMGLPFSFNGILLREMRKLLEVTVRDPLAPDGKRKLILTPEDLPDGGAFYRALEQQIKDTDLSQFPISPIDYIKRELQAGGVRVGEITARDGELTEEGGEAVLGKREQAERNVILRDYNHGALDAIIVNGASSTGVSAHTDPRFRDQRQRVMIVAQPQPDITAMMQMLGRIMRFGQTKLPEYIFLRSSLAAEKRFLTMLRGKLASLNANTSADTESDVTQQKDFAEDIFNEIGDEVVFRVLQAHPDAVALAQIQMPMAQQGEAPDTDGFARKATGGFVLLPNADAQALWDEIDDAYRNEIRLLDELGENPLKATPEDLRAETLEKSDYVAGTGNTQFDGPATLEKVRVRLTNKPLTHDEATAMAEQNDARVRQEVSAWLQQSRVAERERIATATARGSTSDQLDRIRTNFQEAREKVSQALTRMGRTFGVDGTGSGQPQFYGVVVNLRLRGKETADFSSASRQEVVLATNTARRTLTFAVSKTEGVDRYLVDNLPGAEDALFNDTSETNTTRHIVTGNILRGYEQGINASRSVVGSTAPRVVVFTRANGSLETGILMPPGFDPAAQPVSQQRPIRTAREFADAIASDTPVAAGEVRIIHGELTVPANGQWRRVWGNPRFSEFVPYAPQRGAVMAGQISGGAKAERLFDWLVSLGLPVSAIGQPDRGGRPGRGSQFALAPTARPGKGMSIKQATEALNPLAFGGLPPNTVVTHRLDLTHNGRGVRGWYDPNMGQIYLNAAYLTSPEQARATFIEEAFHAVQNDPAIQAAVARIFASLTPEQLAATRAVYGNLDTQTLQYEAVADVLEQETLTHEQRGLMAKLWLALKDAITRLLGKVNSNWSSVDTDARTIIARALRAAAEGKRTNLAKAKPIYARNALVVPPGARASQLALTAHHGTPHQFDRFSTSKIGTGEGAQVYGWGLYFAENPEVAQQYRDTLTRSENASRNLTAEDLSTLRQSPQWPNDVPSHLADQWDSNMENGVPVTWADVEDGFSSYSSRSEAQAAIESILERWSFDVQPVKGQQYTVSLNVEPDELLDWDKPLSEQSEQVRKAIVAAGAAPELMAGMSGAQIYREFERPTGNLSPRFDRDYSQIASATLAANGIKGIRYLDQGSRGNNLRLLPPSRAISRKWTVGDPSGGSDRTFDTEAEARAYMASAQRTYNYVVFNEDDIAITHANGQPVSVEQAQQEQSGEPAPLLFALGDPVDPANVNLSQASVDLSASRVAELGRARLADFTAAAGRLDQLAYDRAGYTKAGAELKRLTDLATGRIQQMPEPNWNLLPDPDAGVAVREDLDSDGNPVGDRLIEVDNTFTDRLDALGVDHDPDMVRAAQAEIYFERRALQLVNQRRELESREFMADYYAKLPAKTQEKLKEEIATNNRSIGQRRRAIENAEVTILERGQDGRTGRAGTSSQTVGERANEIQAAQDGEIENRAMAGARLVPQVQEVFGEPGANRDNLLAVLRELFASLDKPTGWAKRLLMQLRWGKNLELARQVAESADPVAAMSKLSENQRQTVTAILAKLFQQFDAHRTTLHALHGNKVAQLSARIQKLKQEAAAAQEQTGNEQVLENDVRLALAGNHVTGTLQTQAEIQTLLGNLGAVVEYAKRVGAQFETNRKLYDQLTTYTGQTLPADMARTLGLNEQTLQTILDVARKSPDFNSAVTALIRHAAREVSGMPAVSLKEIADVVNADKAAGVPDAKVGEAVKPLVQRMLTDAQAAVSASKLEQRRVARELADLTVQLRTLELAVDLFDSVAGSSEFNALRSHIENADGAYTLDMVVDNPSAKTFLSFGTPGKTPHAAEFTLQGINQDFMNVRAAWRSRITDWMHRAQDYVDAYDTALARHQLSPSIDPSPFQLGFDAPTARGLKLALQGELPLLLTGTDMDPLSAVNNNPAVRKLMANGFVGGLFRQHEKLVELVGGMLGQNLKGYYADWINYALKTHRVLKQFSNLDVLRSDALRSHPSLKNDLAAYDARVFQPLANEARQFGTRVAAGYTLANGETVTKADMDYLRRQVDFFNALRRDVTEVRSDRGIRENVGGRVLTRAGASPGDLPLARTLDFGRGNGFVNALVYADKLLSEAIQSRTGAPAALPTTAAQRAFDPAATDLTLASTHPLVQFWHANMGSLLAHIHDAGRTDRSMKLNPLMQTAEVSLARDLRSGTANPNSLAELARMLAARLPGGTGVNPLDFVTRQLGAELDQYLTEAREVADTEKARAKNSGVEVRLSTESEFTKPAALLRLPSNLYQYGAVSDGAVMLAAARANHDRVIDFASALLQTQRDINEAVAFFVKESGNGPLTVAREAEIFADYGGSKQAAEEMAAIIKALHEDLLNGYDSMSQTTVQQGAGDDMVKWVVGNLLASPTVGINNVVSGGIPKANFTASMNRVGIWAALWRWTKDHLRTLPVLGLAAANWAAHKLDAGIAAWLKQPANARMFQGWVTTLGEKLLNENWTRDLAAVQRLGFSNRDKFQERFKQIWREVAEYSDVTDQRKVTGSRLRQTGRRARAVLRTTTQATIKLGVEAYDQLINVLNLAAVQEFEESLRKFALEYGHKRERDGLTTFDLNDARWNVLPGEWSKRWHKSADGNALGQLKAFLAKASGTSGLVMEKALWDYYQAQKTNPQARLFTGDQFDAVARALLAEWNGSTPGNRPSATVANPWAKTLMLLQGYSSNLSLQMLGSFAGTRGQKNGEWLANSFAKLGSILVIATLMGLASQAEREWWKRRFQGVQTKNPTLLDAEFWSDPVTAAKASGMALASGIPYLGGLAMALHDVQSGGKGYDVSNQFVLASVVSKILQAGRGAYEMPLRDWDVPAADLMRGLIPGFKEMAHMAGMVRAGRNATANLSGAIDRVGLPVPKAGATGQASYSATTGIKQKLVDGIERWKAAMRDGDDTKAASALSDAEAQRDRLVAYYVEQRGMTPTAARAAAWRDYEDLNPVRKAYKGKVMTAEEFAKVDAALGDDDRATQTRTALADFKEGGQVLFGKQVHDTKQASGPAEEREPRASSGGAGGGTGGGGGGGGFGLARSGVSRQGLGNASAARISSPARSRVRGVSVNRLRVGRVASGRTRVPTVRFARLARPRRNRVRV